MGIDKKRSTGRAIGYLVDQAAAALERDRHAPGVVYLGPPAQTPVLLFELVVRSREEVCKHYPNFKCLPPTLGW